MSLAQRLRGLANRLGLEVYPVSRSMARRRLAAMRDLGVDLVFDIGANAGQYASGLRRLGYVGAIVSFEPGAEAYARLQAASERDAGWEAVCSGLGAETGQATLNLAGNSASSSLRPMLDTLTRAVPETAYVGSETVQIVDLPTAWGRHGRPDARAWLKMDVQGYEGDILDGAGSALERFLAVEFEAALTPLYAGEALMEGLVVRLRDAGFVPCLIETGLTDADGWRALEVDIVMVRSALLG